MNEMEKFLYQRQQKEMEERKLREQKDRLEEERKEERRKNQEEQERQKDYLETRYMFQEDKLKLLLTSLNADKFFKQAVEVFKDSSLEPFFHSYSGHAKPRDSGEILITAFSITGLSLCSSYLDFVQISDSDPEGRSSDSNFRHVLKSFQKEELVLETAVFNSSDGSVFFFPPSVQDASARIRDNDGIFDNWVKKKVEKLIGKRNGLTILSPNPQFPEFCKFDVNTVRYMHKKKDPPGQKARELAAWLFGVLFLGLGAGDVKFGDDPNYYESTINLPQSTYTGPFRRNATVLFDNNTLINGHFLDPNFSYLQQSHPSSIIEARVEQFVREYYPKLRK